jgi:dihydroflavonol-4-reductase
MKVLIVGGVGMIGGTAALYFRDKGHDVTLAGRTPAPEDSPLAEFPFVRIDFIANDTGPDVLGAFDTVVFCAGNDPRHNKSMDDAHWVKANSEAVPAFFASLRDAGVKNAINVGSFYPQAAPELVDKHPYVASRKAADDGVRALNRPGFRAISVNAPFVVGSVPGMRGGLISAYTKYAKGKMGIEEFAIPGGVNLISARSLVEAIGGAIERGEGGKAYLVGDENLTFQEYFGAFFEAVGRTAPPVIDKEHPLFPDDTLFQGRGNTLYFEPDADEVALLGYRRNDVVAGIKEAVAQLGN